MKKAFVPALLTLALTLLAACAQPEAETIAQAIPAKTATAVPTDTPTSTPTPTPTNTPTTTHTPTATPTDMPTPTNTPSPTSTPTPRPYLAEKRLVTYYGWPKGRALGILGNSPRDEMLVDLRRVAAEYQALSAESVWPAFHMITTVAHTEPPNYSYQLEAEIIEDWITFAEQENAAVILDLQPGRADLMSEVERLLPYLYHENVHLALDPEWTMDDTQIPLVHIGQMYAEQINEVQAVLNQIAIEIGVNRVLILHEFKDSMLPDKADIMDYPFVEVVIDSDGAFSAEVKMDSYLQYTTEPAFEYGGIKLFTVRDRRLLTPEEVMALQPQPRIIIYQ
ncbi:MAG: hypothetical protein ACE5EY_17265 [Anaerolineae bacterium]